MDIYNIIIILLVFIITYKYWCHNFIKNIKNTENLENIGLVNGSDKKDDEVANKNDDPLNKTKTLTKQIDLLEQKEFEDVVVFRSTPIWGEGLTGLQKCMENCVGSCVEIGVTNNAMCFPRK